MCLIRGRCLKGMFFCRAFAYNSRGLASEDDVFKMPEEHSTECITARLETKIRECKIQHPGKPISMFEVQELAFRWPMLFACIINYVSLVCLLVGSVLLKFILDDWLSTPDNQQRNYPLFWACIALFLVHAWAKAYSDFMAKEVGLCLTKGINGVILNKVLTLSHKSLADCSQGKLLALIAQDSEYVTEQFS